MEDRLLLDKIDYENKCVTINGVTWPMEDVDFPTVDPKDPYTLTPEESSVIDQLTSSFLNSEKLQRHIRFLYSKGSIYKIYNGNLLFHGCIPMDKEGNFLTFNLDGVDRSGKDFLQLLVFRHILKRQFELLHSLEGRLVVASIDQLLQHTLQRNDSHPFARQMAHIIGIFCIFCLRETAPQVDSVDGSRSPQVVLDHTDIGIVGMLGEKPPDGFTVALGRMPRIIETEDFIAIRVEVEMLQIVAGGRHVMLLGNQPPGFSQSLVGLREVGIGIGKDYIIHCRAAIGVSPPYHPVKLLTGLLTLITERITVEERLVRLHAVLTGSLLIGQPALATLRCPLHRRTEGVLGSHCVSLLLGSHLCEEPWSQWRQSFLHQLSLPGAGIVFDVMVVGSYRSRLQVLLIDTLYAELLQPSHHLHVETENLEVSVDLLFRHIGPHSHSVAGGSDNCLLLLTEGGNGDSLAQQTSQVTIPVVLNQPHMTLLGTLDILHCQRQVTHRIRVVEIEKSEIVESLHIVGRQCIGSVELGETRIIVHRRVGEKTLRPCGESPQQTAPKQQQPSHQNNFKP
ncbi:MAG: fructose-bisphosphatase class III [Prevotella sp.]